jgi:O-antigen ligase
MQGEKLERIIFYLLLLFLPTQFGKHFWPEFSIISGLRVDYLSPTLYVTDIIILLLFIVWFIRIIRNAKFTSWRIAFNYKSLFLFLGFLIFNIYLSQNVLNGVYHFVKLLEFLFVAYYVATTIVSLEQVKKVFFVLGISVIFQSGLAITQFLKQGSLGGVFYFFGERLFTAATPGIANASINGELLLRPYGTFSHPNVLAGFLLLGMISLLFSLSWTKKREKMVWAPALLLGSSALLLTMSRVALLVWIGLLLSVFLRQISVKPGKPLLALLFLFIFTFFIMGTPFGSRLLQTNRAEEAVVQRTELMRASAVMIGQQPVIGIGFGNFLPELTRVQKPLSPGLYLQPVHNIFLLILTEIGIVGFSFFLWFLFQTYKRLFQHVKKTKGFPYRIFIVLLTVILVLGSFDHYFLTLQQGQLLFAFIVGLSWVTIKS